MFKTKYKPTYLIKKAEHVITCSPYLDTFIRKYNSNTTDISSTVDPAKKYNCVNLNSNDKPLTIGWSGSHFTTRYFVTITNVLLAIQQKYPGIKIMVMGGSNTQAPDLKVESTE